MYVLNQHRQPRIHDCGMFRSSHGQHGLPDRQCHSQDGWREIRKQKEGEEEKKTVRGREENRVRKRRKQKEEEKKTERGRKENIVRKRRKQSEEERSVRS